MIPRPADHDPISPFILSVYISEACEISVLKKKVKPLFIKTYSELTPLALVGYILEMQNFKSGMVVHAFIPNTCYQRRSLWSI